MLHRTLGLVLLLSLPALAREQLRVVDPGVADEAQGKLPEGGLVIEWGPGEGPPRLAVVLACAVIEVAGDRRAEVHLERRRLAEARPAREGLCGMKWAFAREAGEPESGPVDLAGLFVASREVPGMFVCLGRLLRQPCQPRWPALDIPDLDREEAERRVGELRAGPAPGEAAPIEVHGFLRASGRRLVVSEEAGGGEVAWELLPAPGREAALAILRGRDAVEVELQLLPQDPADGKRRKAQLLRVRRLTRPVESGDDDPATGEGPGALGFR